MSTAPRYSSCTQNTLFLTFSVLVANPKKLLYTVVANPPRGLLNSEKRTKEKVWQHTPPSPPPAPLHTARSEKNISNKNHTTHLQALRRSRSVSRPYKDLFGSSTRPMGVASQNSTLPSAITSFPVSLLLSSLLAMSSRIYLFFPPCGHEPPSTLLDRLSPHASL